MTNQIIIRDGEGVMHQTVEEYVEAHPRSGQPRKGDPSVPSPWLLLTTYAHGSGPVCLLDPGELPRAFLDFDDTAEDAPSLMIPIAGGEYEVRLQMANYGLECRTSGLRMAPSGASVARGEQLGTTATDTAVTALLDPEEFRRAWPALADRWETEFADELIQYDWAVIPLDERAVVILTTSGYGDGTYPVFALVDEKGAPAGFEVEFFPVDMPYKF